MNNEFVNVYIERLTQEVTDLNKSRLLLETQLKYSEKYIEELTEKLKTYENNDNEVKKKEVVEKDKSEIDTSVF